MDDFKFGMIHQDLNLNRINWYFTYWWPKDLFSDIHLDINTKYTRNMFSTVQKMELNHFYMCAKGVNINLSSFKLKLYLYRKDVHVYWLLFIFTKKNCCKWSQSCVTQTRVYLSSYNYCQFSSGWTDCASESFAS